MSQENVEITKRSIDAFNARNLDAYDELFTPDSEWSTAMGSIEGEIFRGREGTETYFGRLGDTWEEYRILATEFRDLGDRVLALGRIEGRGRASGITIDSPWALIDGFRDGKVSRIRVFLDPAEALRVAGLAD
jgi:ketosteroid isomerase-like protein